tara:strand:- start:1302 stop:1640 length:339 start_codon:yes stop_codon:yes gene_type:complete
LDRDNAKARRESGFEDDDEDEEDDEEDFGVLDEELVSKKRRLFLRRLGSQFRVNARSEMDMEEDATFLWCKRRRLEKVIHHTEDDVTCFLQRRVQCDGNECSWGSSSIYRTR